MIRPLTRCEANIANIIPSSTLKEKAYDILRVRGICMFLHKVDDITLPYIYIYIYIIFICNYFSKRNIYCVICKDVRKYFLSI